MASTYEICEAWQLVRDGLIKEVESIPADQFEFRAAEGSRNVLEQIMPGDGKRLTKRAMLNLGVGHEMYHRGQVTVYQRLLGIEPALTKVVKQVLASGG